MAWFSENYIELIGAIAGLVYLYFSIKQNILLWPLGIITSAIYVYVFFVTKFYADMGLQVYYLVISIYGWYTWSRGKYLEKDKKELPVTQLRVRSWPVVILVTAFLTVGISFILIRYTDSELPYWDAFTTAASIVATWMLARKIIDHWIFWIIIDAVSAGLYTYKELYPTVGLFVVYTVMAVIGYRTWRKELIVSDS
jgi:nicotinamide mononucleotide transporter